MEANREVVETVNMGRSSQETYQVLIVYNEREKTHLVKIEVNIPLAMY